MKRFSIIKAFLFSIETIKKYPLLILIPAIISRSLVTGFSFLIRNDSVVSALRIFPKLTLINLSVLLLFVVAVITTSIASIGLIRIACFAFDNQNESIQWSAYGTSDKGVLNIFIAYHSIVLGSTFLIRWFFRSMLFRNNLYTLPFFYLVGFFIWLPFLFTPFLLVEKNMSLQDAFRESFWLTKGIKGSLVAFFISYRLLSMVINYPLFYLNLLLGDFILILSTLVWSIMFAFLQVAIIYIYKDISYQDEKSIE